MAKWKWRFLSGREPPKRVVKEYYYVTDVGIPSFGEDLKGRREILVMRLTAPEVAEKVKLFEELTAVANAVNINNTPGARKVGFGDLLTGNIPEIVPEVTRRDITTRAERYEQIQGPVEKWNVPAGEYTVGVSCEKMPLGSLHAIPPEETKKED